jgi:hypothetical protein
VPRRGLALSALLIGAGAPRLAAQCPNGSPPPCRQPARPVAPAAHTVAVLYFHNLSPDVVLGRLLRVRYLVEGSVRRVGTQVRVSARLLGAGDGFRVWSAVYDRSASDEQAQPRGALFWYTLRSVLNVVHLPPSPRLNRLIQESRPP